MRGREGETWDRNPIQKERGERSTTSPPRRRGKERSISPNGGGGGAEAATPTNGERDKPGSTPKKEAGKGKHYHPKGPPQRRREVKRLLSKSDLSWNLLSTVNEKSRSVVLWSLKLMQILW